MYKNVLKKYNFISGEICKRFWGTNIYVIKMTVYHRNCGIPPKIYYNATVHVSCVLTWVWSLLSDKNHNISILKIKLQYDSAHDGLMLIDRSKVI